MLADDILFPPPHLARADGLLAVGGDLSEKRLLLAYEMGIFPWYSEAQPILWWSPDPRLVLYPGELRISRSLKKTLKKNLFHITMDLAFDQVIQSCARVRLDQYEATWIVDDMIDAYIRLHQAGYAHSVEAWHENTLAGGLYGVSVGGCFFGESMFTRISNASKVAFVYFVEYLRHRSFKLIDCQVTTNHLIRFGAREIPRRRFLKELQEALQVPTHFGKWTFDSDEKGVE